MSYNICETGIFYSIPNSTLYPCATITGELCVWNPVIDFGCPAYPIISTACPTLTKIGSNSNF